MRDRLTRNYRLNIFNNAVSGVMLFTLIGKLLGFLRELVLAHFFGASNVTDAYLISQTIPGTLFQIVGTGISTCFVPIYLRLKNKGESDEFIQFTNRFITMILFVTILLIFFTLMFTEPIVKMFAMGFEQETLKLAVDFTRISVISLVASAFVYVYTALLNAEKKFIPAAFGVIPYNAGLLLAIIIGAEWNIYGLSLVSALAVIGQLMYQLYHVNSIPYKFILDIHLYDENIKSALKMLPPVLLGVAAAEINILVDRTLASAVVVGGITVVTYGTSLFNMVIGIFSQSISSVYYPVISQAVIEDDKDKLELTIKKAVEMAMFFLIPLTFGAIIMAKPIVMILFKHGDFSLESVNLVAGVFVFYAIGFVFFSLKQILNNVFYAKQETKIPMINTVIGIVINILGNIVLAPIMGLNGLAIATSISSVCIAFLLVVCIKKQLGINPLPKFIISIKYVIAACFMGAVCWLIMQYVNLGLLFTSVISIVIGVIVYFGLTYFFKVNVVLGRKI